MRDWILAEHRHGGGGGRTRIESIRLTGYNKRSVPTRSPTTERYRSGRNGGASKASCPVRGTWVRIPPSPPLPNAFCINNLLDRVISLSNFLPHLSRIRTFGDRKRVGRETLPE
jgi:hypothetical protein